MITSCNALVVSRARVCVSYIHLGWCGGKRSNHAPLRFHIVSYQFQGLRNFGGRLRPRELVAVSGVGPSGGCTNRYPVVEVGLDTNYEGSSGIVTDQATERVYKFHTIRPLPPDRDSCIIWYDVAQRGVSTQIGSHTMRTAEYVLTGKEVPQSLAGTVIRIRVPETLEDAKALTKNGESDVVAKFGDGYAIALQGQLRTRSGKTKDGALVETPESLQKLADEYVYAVLAKGAPKSVKPETKAKRAAVSSGNKLFEKARADEKFRAQMIKNGIIDEAEFGDWLAENAGEAASQG